MIRLFNSLQIVALFAAMPYLFQWLGSEPFAYASAAFWLLACVYAFLFGMLTTAVYGFTDGK